MTLVIAIYGPAAVGKSIVAREVAKQIGAQSRHCGDAVKSRARELGLDLEDISLDEHRKIDAETHRVASTASEPLVIEGRFLDSVLEDIPHVILVGLTCEFSERIRRHSLRGGTAESLQNADMWSEKFQIRCYGTKKKRQARLVTIETEGLEADQVATEVLQEVRRLTNDAI